ncbi:Heterogeneous nuclear ribonucleoprotein 1 [Linum perenne]
MAYRSRNDNPHSGDGASPGKIFIGGLAKGTTYETFNDHFGKYGEITDSVIMKDRHTGQPRGFGFITYADPSVVDTVIEDQHIISGKQVEIKRTIPKGSGQSKDFKTKKIFVGGIPPSVSEDEFQEFFSKYGTVVERQIIRDHETNRSRGFGFIIFDSDDIVDEILTKGNLIDMAGTQVSLSRYFERDKNVIGSILRWDLPIPFYYNGKNYHLLTCAFCLTIYLVSYYYCSVVVAIDISAGIDFKRGLTIVSFLQKLG